jgi:tetratricopeptide (TPR) repeat protein
MGHQFSLQAFFAKTSKKTIPSSGPSKPGKQIMPAAPAQTDSTAAGDDDTLIPAPVVPENPVLTPTPVTDGSALSPEDDMMVWYQKGISAYKGKNYALAVQCLEKAVKKDDPKVKDFYYAEAYSTLGSLYQRHMEASRPNKAREYFLKALQIDPDTESAQKGLKQLDESGQ